MSKTITFPNDSMSITNSGTSMSTISRTDAQDFDMGLDGGISMMVRPIEWEGLTKEMVDILKELAELKKMGSYSLGKNEAYKTIVSKFDKCSTIPEIYQVINDLREQVANSVS
jgi:hypothetical protein